MAAGMGDWVYARLSKVPTDTLIKMWNTYIAGEFGGMNEAMARMYRLTGKPNHLKTAQLFDNIRVFYGDTQHSHGLAKNVDLFRGLHANQHIPQVVGSIETYRATNNPEYYKIADNFWYKMVNDYMYSIEVLQVPVIPTMPNVLSASREPCMKMASLPVDRTKPVLPIICLN
nr:beta-L-arabinofuranosidase domain-containing protein [Paraflavitalea speifideiaquila]